MDSGTTQQTSIIAFRQLNPKRTCIKTYQDYRSYKLYLRTDFNERCGYCDERDQWSGGQKGFQIDHFVPRKPFFEEHPELETAYNNLVYACSNCNRSKSNIWVSNDSQKACVGNEGFIDPCDEAYNKQFCRNQTGHIVARTTLGKYIYKTLNLGIDRHALTWNLDALTNQINQLEQLHHDKDMPELNKQRITERKNILQEIYFKVMQCFLASQ